MNLKNLAEIVVILFGLFLIIDSFFLSLISFAYPDPIIFLDSVIDHWMIGVGFVAIGFIGLWKFS